MARDVYEDHDEKAATDGVGNALVILTTILLLVAIFLMQKALGDHYNAGLFGGQESPAPVLPPQP